jgi:hypothetical protein|nr:MAG TPA: hypothetical protein [Inoviridae sp.]
MMIDYCAAWFFQSGALEMVLTGSFHDLYCHTPLVYHVLPQYLGL